MSKHPLVTIARPMYEDIVAQAIASKLETGGIIMGRGTRGRNRKVTQLCEGYGRTTKSAVFYTETQRSGAVRDAEDRCPELLYLGEWHSHRYDFECILTGMPAISEYDAMEMLIDKVEVIATVFPSIEKKLKNRWDCIWVAINGMQCGVEAWLRTKKKQVVPCRVEVR